MSASWLTGFSKVDDSVKNRSSAHASWSFPPLPALFPWHRPAGSTPSAPHVDPTWPSLLGLPSWLLGVDLTAEMTVLQKWTLMQSGNHNSGNTGSSCQDKHVREQCLWGSLPAPAPRCPDGAPAAGTRQGLVSWCWVPSRQEDSDRPALQVQLLRSFPFPTPGSRCLPFQR